jgi:alpha-glucosidase
MSGVETIGTCLSHDWNGKMLHIGTWGYDIQVSFVANDICRIRARHCGNKTQDHSYATHGRRKPIKVKFSETDDELMLKSSDLTLIIQKDPVRFTLLNKKGKVLTQDDTSFGLSSVGTQVSCYRTLQANERFLGLGAASGPIDKKGLAFNNRNFQGHPSPSGSASIPFFIGVHEQGVYGVFLDNSYQSSFDFGSTSSRFSWFSCEDGEMDQYLMTGKNVAAVIESYTSLTGRMKLPPIWSLGHHCNAPTDLAQDELEALADTLRRKNFPTDVLSVDIGSSSEQGGFSVDSTRLATPEKLISRLTKKGFRVVCAVSPEIKVEKGFGPYVRGKTNDVFVKMSDGTPYEVNVLNNRVLIPDFTKPQSRDWWAQEMRFYHKLGAKGIASKASANGPLAKDLPSVLEFDYDGKSTSQREVRNVYDMQFARANTEGMQMHAKGERSFVCSPTGFAGIQNYSALILNHGQKVSSPLLESSVAMQNLGLSGVSFSGVDPSDGFSALSPECMSRWFSLMAFQPLCQSSVQLNSRATAPWDFGPDVEQISRNYLTLRHVLLPYIYMAMKASADTGVPLVRALAIDYTHDKEVYMPQYQAEYMFGSSLLVVPCEHDETLREAYLPAGKWYDFYTDTQFSKGKLIVDCPAYKLPVFVRAGSIVPMHVEGGGINKGDSSDLKLHLYLGASGEVELYEDDGLTMDSAYAKRTMVMTKTGLEIGPQKGRFKSEYDSVTMYFHGLKSKRQVKVDGKKIVVSHEDLRFVQSIENDRARVEKKGQELLIHQLPFVKVNWKKSSIKVDWS